MTRLTDKSGNGVQGRLLVEDGLRPGSTIGTLSIQDLSGNNGGRRQIPYEVESAGLGNVVRFLRVFVEDTLNANYCSIAEVEVLSPASVAVLGGTPTASSQFGGANDPSKARDGVVSTWWATASGQKANSWIQVDFGSPVEIGSVRLVPVTGSPTHMPSALRLQTSDDGILWNDRSRHTPTWVDGVAQTFALVP